RHIDFLERYGPDYASFLDRPSTLEAHRARLVATPAILHRVRQQNRSLACSTFKPSCTELPPSRISRDPIVITLTSALVPYVCRAPTPEERIVYWTLASRLG